MHPAQFSLSVTLLWPAEIPSSPWRRRLEKSLRTAIAPNLHMRGIQDNLFRLFSILLDNAVKYCDPGGEIDFTITRRGRLASIIVSNPCAGLGALSVTSVF